MSKYIKNLTGKNAKALKSNILNSKKKVGRPPKSDWSSIEDAKKFAKENNIETSSEWRRWVKLNKIPNNFPKQPDKTYKNINSWVSWKSFFNKEKEIIPSITGNSIKVQSGSDILKGFFYNNSSDLKKYLGNEIYSLLEVIFLINIFENRVPSSFKEIEKSLSGYTRLNYKDDPKVPNFLKTHEGTNKHYSIGELLPDKQFEFSYFSSVYLNFINNFNTSDVLHSSLVKKLQNMPDVMSSLKDGETKIDIKVFINDKKIKLDDETLTFLSTVLQINKNSIVGLGLSHMRSFDLRSKESLIEQLGYIKPKKNKLAHKKIDEKIKLINESETFPFNKEETIKKIKTSELNKEAFDAFISEYINALIIRIQQISNTLNNKSIKIHSLGLTLSQIREIINVPRRVIAENMPDKNISQSTIMHIERFGTYPGDEKNHPEKAFNLIVGIFRSYKSNPSPFFVILDQSLLFHESILNPAWKYFKERMNDIDEKDNNLRQQLIEFKNSIFDIKNNYKNENYLNKNIKSQWSKIVLLYWLAKEEIYNSPFFHRENKNQGSSTTKISKDIFNQTDKSYFHFSPQGLSLMSRYLDEDGDGGDVYTDLFLENVNSYFNKKSNSVLDISKFENQKESYQISNELLPFLNKKEDLIHFQVIDESMEPKISKNDTIIISKINIQSIKDIKFGKMYALMDDYNINIRSIMQPGNLKKGFINIHPYNNDWPSSDIDFPSVSIIGIVKGIIKEA